MGYGDNNPKNPLVVKETGKALEDFTKLCTDDTIVYGLVRVVNYPHTWTIPSVMITTPFPFRLTWWTIFPL